MALSSAPPRGAMVRRRWSVIPARYGAFSFNRRSILAAAWCERGDSNPHALRHWYLKPGRLPIPPLSQYRHQPASRSLGDRRGANKKRPLAGAPRASLWWWAVKDSNLGPID